MKYNLCIIQPPQYVHSGAFIELAELMQHSLADLGYTSTISFNTPYIDSRNIIIGAHLLDISYISQFKSQFPSSVIVNTEQFGGLNDGKWKNSIFEWISNFETWDYSDENITILKNMGISNIKLLGIGFHEKLNRIKKSANQDIDILFYGSGNERRLRVLNALKACGYNVAVIFGLYGEERDNLIARSKIVLNLHYYDSKIFEIIRVFYLMTNSKAVVSEVSNGTHINPIYLSGFYSAAYENLISACKTVLADDKARQEIELKAFETISQYPQREFTQLLLA